MPISFACKCGKRLSAKESLAGKKVRCPGCGEPVKIPGGAPPAKGGGGPKVARKPAAQPASKRPVRKPKRGTQTDLFGPDFDGHSGDRKTQQEDLECPNCTASYFEGDPFCMSCGTDLKTGKLVDVPKGPPAWKAWLKPLIVLAVVGVVAYVVWVKFIRKEAGSGVVQRMPQEHLEMAISGGQGGETVLLDALFKTMQSQDPGAGPDAVITLVEKYLHNPNGEVCSRVAKVLYALCYFRRAPDKVLHIAEKITGLQNYSEGDRRICLYAMFCLRQDTIRPTALLPALATAPPFDSLPAINLLQPDMPKGMLVSAVGRQGIRADAIFIQLLLGNQDPFYQRILSADRDESAGLLAEITGLAMSKEEWAAWWEEKKDSHPMEWLIQGVEEGTEANRGFAQARLHILTGQDLDSAQAWKDWLAANLEKFRIQGE